ncbi:MAG: segregation/condensation protein A [Gammaproteobacteria bacterium]|nr:segregation/condensation protein A [Gammaproteobacteria bacterium]
MTDTPIEAPLATRIALVRGDAYTELPQDLYIPPNALEVFLEETFEGPLDLLLYLIRKENLDILDIPIAEVTRQYMRYIDLMVVLKIELAAEYLLMAAMLAEIKSRMLLPRPQAVAAEETDPRAELVRRLQEYERYRQAAEGIDQLPRVGRDIHLVVTDPDHIPRTKTPPNVALDDLVEAFRQVMERAALHRHHRVKLEPLSVRERMTEILARVQAQEFLSFQSLFEPHEGRLGLVVTFIAILELLKESLIVAIQQEPYAPIHVKAAA